MKRTAQIKKLSEEKFVRLTGVKRRTYDRMVEILRGADKEKMRAGGRPSKMSVEDKLLVWLDYMREYGTYFHTGIRHEISEATCYRVCIWVEGVLIKSKEFRLPNKNTLTDDTDIEVILVDATESIIERPKKNKDGIIQERKRSIR